MWLFMVLGSLSTVLWVTCAPWLCRLVSYWCNILVMVEMEWSKKLASRRGKAFNTRPWDRRT
jgi:hypothetical protein